MPTKKAVVKKKPVAPKAKPVKKPKFKLISYTLKAVIPVGQYANIQPEVTVQAKSIEAAERAVMPYIETLFAKYRDGGVKPIEPVVIRPVAPVASKPIEPILTKESIKVAEETTKNTLPEPGKVMPPSAPVTVEPAIILTVPYTRAKSAVESCMSHDNLKLVASQIEKSTKLIDSEKADLRDIVTKKYNDITMGIK